MTTSWNHKHSIKVESEFVVQIALLCSFSPLLFIFTEICILFNFSHLLLCFYLLYACQNSRLFVLSCSYAILSSEPSVFVVEYLYIHISLPLPLSMYVCVNARMLFHVTSFCSNPGHLYRFFVQRWCLGIDSNKKKSKKMEGTLEWRSHHRGEWGLCIVGRRWWGHSCYSIIIF